MHLPVFYPLFFSSSRIMLRVTPSGAYQHSNCRLENFVIEISAANFEINFHKSSFEAGCRLIGELVV